MFGEILAMRRLAAAAVAALCVHGTAMAAQGDLDNLVTARLLAEPTALAPGGEAWLAVELSMKPGWHTYWRNPGDSGQPTAINWILPKNYRAGAIHWPVPRQIPAGIGVSYGYADTVALLVPLIVPKLAQTGAQVEIAATVEWLVCKEICVPGEVRLSLKLPVAVSAPPDAAAKTLFDKARAALPAELAAPAKGKAGESALVLELPDETLKGIAAPQAVFMPFDDTLIDHAAPQTLKGATLALKRGQVQGKPPAETGGLLLVEDKAGGISRAYNLSVQIKTE